MSRYYYRSRSRDWADIVALFIIAAAFNFASAVIAAQLVVWGLSYMHVNSGLIGPWLILGGIGLTVTTAVNTSGKS